MKCKRELCANEVPVRIQNVGMVYCSRDCAPYGNLDRFNPFQYTRKQETSSTQERGAQSQVYERRTERTELAQNPSPEPQSKSLEREKRTETGTGPTRTESTRANVSRELRGVPNSVLQIQERPTPEKSETTIKPERYGTIGMQETGMSTTEKNDSEGGSATPHVDYSRQQTNLEEARLLTMSTIDESATLLLDCMRLAAKKNGDQGVRDYRDLNAICNIGKQIAQLAKVKLDAIKEARK